MNVQDNRILASIWRYHQDLIDDLKKVSSEEEFSSSYDVYRLVSFDLIQISEAISKLSYEFKMSLESPLLNGIIGMKSILLNGNNIVDTKILYKTVNETLPSLIKQINNLGYYDLVYSLIGKGVLIQIDRKINTVHPTHNDIVYKVNYGYTTRLISPDGEYLDAYLLGIDNEVDSYFGKVIGVIHRLNDIEDKLVVAPFDTNFTKDEILSLTYFQEKYFDIELMM